MEPTQSDAKAQPILFPPSNHSLLVVLGIIHSFVWNYYHSCPSDGLTDDSDDPANEMHPKIISWNWVLYISNMLSKNEYDWEKNYLKLYKYS